MTCKLTINLVRQNKKSGFLFFFFLECELQLKLSTKVGEGKELDNV